ncbi:MAG: hypothetical protein JNL70_00720 [Saprospiraceae bacterium]|nr:hypothetical protein [Saprospiraceae bacterium]
MRHSYFIIATILCLFSQNAHAQLVNGSKSLGLYGSVSASISRLESTNLQSTAIKAHYYSANQGITPSYAIFENNFLFGGEIGGSFSGFFNENVTQNQKWTHLYYSAKINSFVRYYVKNSSKVGYFVFADAAYWNTLENHRFESSNINQKVNSSDFDNNDYFNWKVGFGGHKVLNKNFLAEAIIYYENNENIAFYAGLRHIYTAFDKKNTEATPQYIVKSRWQIDASINAKNNHKTKDEAFGMYVFGGKMLNNHFMFGSSISVGMYDFSHVLKYYINVSPFVRYYIPITNRFYAYPEIGFSAMYNNKSYKSIGFQRNIGLQYFMTQNLALTCITTGYFNHYNSSDKRTAANANFQFGISYFVK